MSGLPVLHNMLVSTIIPVFNRSDLIVDAVQSVLEQTYRPIEIILVDDGSTDDTPSVLSNLAARNPDIVRVVHRVNGGPGAARETGRLVARGDFIQYLDSDDRLLPKKFEIQVTALEKRPDAGVAYCPTYEVELGKPFSGPPSCRTGEQMEQLFPALLTGRIWQTSTPLLRRVVSDALGPWTTLRQEEDWEYDSRIAALGTRLVWVPDFLAVHIHHSGERAGGNSLGNPIKMKWRATAQSVLFEKAVAAGLDYRVPEMQQFSRSLFLLSRQCGMAGLAQESQSLFSLAKQAAGPIRAKKLDFIIYEAVSKFLGWRQSSRLACFLDEMRR